MEKAMDCSVVRDDMMDVLYGEADAEVAERFETHRRACAACRDELQSLEAVRRDLQSWDTPAVRPARRFLAPVWRSWAAAAAVTLAFTSGLLVARTEIQVQDGAVQVRFAPATNPAASTDTRATLVRDEVRAQLAALKQVPAPARVSTDQPALLQEVQEMIRQSEARQAVMLRSGLSELWQTAEARRREDIARISAGFSYLESKTGVEAAKTSELMNRFLRVSEDGGK
jgi:hypothetical protein